MSLTATANSVVTIEADHQDDISALQIAISYALNNCTNFTDYQKQVLTAANGVLVKAISNDSP